MKSDGAGRFRIYWQLMLPLAKPILATIGIMAAVTYWNDWTNSLYYITDSKLHSVQQLLNVMNNNSLFMANNSASGGGPRLSITSTLLGCFAMVAATMGTAF